MSLFLPVPTGDFNENLRTDSNLKLQIKIIYQAFVLVLLSVTSIAYFSPRNSMIQNQWQLLLRNFLFTDAFVNIVLKGTCK